MISFSEIETTSKRASRAAGYSWGISEEVGKNVRLLEMFGLPGIKNLNDYYNKKKEQKFESLKLINIEKQLLGSSAMHISSFSDHKFIDIFVHNV